jgi:hypothetical protein
MVDKQTDAILPAGMDDFATNNKNKTLSLNADFSYDNFDWSVSHSDNWGYDYININSDTHDIDNSLSANLRLLDGFIELMPGYTTYKSEYIGAGTYTKSKEYMLGLKLSGNEKYDVALDLSKSLETDSNGTTDIQTNGLSTSITWHQKMKGTMIDYWIRGDWTDYKDNLDGGNSNKTYEWYAGLTIPFDKQW